MNFMDWFKPGIKIKRWILMGFTGLAVFVLGISKFLFRGPIFDRYAFLYIYLGMTGIVLIYFAIKSGLKSILLIVSRVNSQYNMGSQTFKDLLYEERLLIRGPRVVAIGGGTGLSTMIRGIKEYTSNITAIVTVADDGGGSGVLRETLGMLPPGDIRNCLVALAHTEPLMEELMQYRFTEGNLKGQSFGNLFIAAMNGISTSFEEAIKKMSEVLAVKGRVYPVTLEDVTLKAKLSNGNIVVGESKIPDECIKNAVKIEKIFLEPENPKPLEDALFAINNADCIIMGPGSLYTSILPNLLVYDIANKIKSSKALKIYVSNIMTQPGETDNFKLSDHIRTIEDYCGKNIIDYVIANNGSIPEPHFCKYKNDGQDIVKIDKENISSDIEVISEDLVNIKNGLLRHDTYKLANAIMYLVTKHGYRKSGLKLIDYYYLSERIKDKKKGLR